MLVRLVYKGLVPTADAGRQAVLNAIASVQPLQITSDLLTADRH